MLNTLMDLLNIESYSGGEQEVIKYVVPILRECGFKIDIDDMGNIMAVRGKAVKYPMLNAHMDSVKGYKTYKKYSYKNTYLLLSEEANMYKESRKIVDSICKKTCTVDMYTRPSNYYCQGCKTKQLIVDAIDKAKNKKKSSVKKCANCSRFFDCIPDIKWQQEIIDNNIEMVCDMFDDIMNGIQNEVVEEKEEFELTYNEKTNEIKSNGVRPMGGDDKCGIAIALQVARETSIPMKILFTVQEEVGCLGVKNIEKNYLDFLSDVKYSITIDRKSGNHLLVTSAGKANCTLKFLAELAKFAILANIPVSLENGSVADVCVIREHVKDAMNISAGYYNPHTNDEYVKFNEVEKIKEWVRMFMTKSIYR